MFDNIIGHDKIKQRLQNCIKEDKLLNAYIFCGQKGIGKKTMAYDFAMEITNNLKEDIFFVTNENYKYKVSLKERKSNDLAVDVVRKVREEIYIKPLGNKKVFIFPDADNMNIQCQNALLKVFEEPPEYGVIILIAENEKTLLQTIRSRAISVKFPPLTKSEVKEFLDKNNIPYDDLVLCVAANSIETAVKLSKDDELKGIITELVKLLNKLQYKKRADFYALESFLNANKTRGIEILDIMLILFEQSLLRFSENNDTMHIKGIKLFDITKIIDLILYTRTACSQNGNYAIFVSELMLLIWEEIN